MPVPIPIVAAVWALLSVMMSLSAFAAFGVDKKRAEGKGGRRRIKEKTLLALAVYGGAIGAALGRAVFRHKTQKFYFSFIIGISLFLQLAVSAIIIFRMTGVL